MVQVRRARGVAAANPLVAVMAALAMIAALAVAAVADGDPAAGLDVDECTPAAEAAAAAAGYECTVLFNKGNPGQGVGSLFVRLDDGVVTMITDLHTLPDTGHSGAKLCIDDEGDPRLDRTSCLGGTAASTVNKAYTIGTGRNQVKPAGTGYEEPSGEYEYMLEGSGALPAATGTFVPGPSNTATRYTAIVGTGDFDPYTEFSLHFNQSSMSIESFFQLDPAPEPLPCDENHVFGGDGLPTLTFVFEKGAEPCEKVLTFSAGLNLIVGDDERQFVDLAPDPSVGDQPTRMFLEHVEWAPVAAGEPPRQLFYDDDHDGIDEPVLMPTCLSDPREVPGSILPLDIDDDLTVALAETDVLPAGNTSCIVDGGFDYVGGEQIQQFHIVFNVGDGKRFY